MDALRSRSIVELGKWPRQFDRGRRVDMSRRAKPAPHGYRGRRDATISHIISVSRLPPSVTRFSGALAVSGCSRNMIGFISGGRDERPRLPKQGDKMFPTTIAGSLPKPP